MSSPTHNNSTPGGSNDISHGPQRSSRHRVTKAAPTNYVLQWPTLDSSSEDETPPKTKCVLPNKVGSRTNMQHSDAERRLANRMSQSQGERTRPGGINEPRRSLTVIEHQRWAGEDAVFIKQEEDIKPPPRMTYKKEDMREVKQEVKSEYEAPNSRPSTYHTN